MVDPDNRRPVDFKGRAETLDAVLADLALDRAGALAHYVDSWRDGRVKLAVTATLLAVRRDHAALFDGGGYQPIAASGPGADVVCAFRRQHHDDEVAVAVARFPGRRDGSGVDPGTTVPLPAGRWIDALTARRFEGGSAKAEALFAVLPAAVLLRDR